MAVFVRRWIAACAVMAGFCAAAGAAPKALNSTALDSVRFMLVHQDYAGAHALLEQHLKSNPDDNEARYMLLAVEQTRILDYESYTLENVRFQGMAESLRGQLESKLTSLRGRDSIHCLFYLANVYGGTSVIQAKTGNWFDAVKGALTSVSILKQVRKLDPQFYAAYLGIGVFEYYLGSSLKWLPFMDDKGERGIQDIEKATKAKFPYNYAAKNSLCWILIERKEFARADSLAQSVLIDVPGNTIFMRIRSMIALWTGNHTRAIELATQWAGISAERSPPNWSDLISAHMVLASGYDKLGKADASLAAANSILGKAYPEGYRDIPHVKKNIGIITELQKKHRTILKPQ